MSFRRTGTGQYPQNPPRQGYQDQYNQYGQPAQNGGYQGQYTQPAYPGQPTYGQYGGSQQQQGAPQAPYNQQQPPQRQASYASQPGQHQYQYNPQNYAHVQQQQAPVQQYNPQNYVNTGRGSYGQQYNAHSFGSPATAVPASPMTATATSGPVDPFAYPQPYRSQTQPPPPPQNYAQTQQQRQNYSPQQSFSPRLPHHSNSFSSQFDRSPTQQYDRYGAPTVAGSQSQNPPYPSNDWRPSPPGPTHVDPRQSPSPLYPTSPNASLPSPPSTTQGPTPPAHGLYRSDTAGRHPESRPLPGIPQHPQQDYFFTQGDQVMHMSRDEAESISQEELFQQVESAVMRVGSPGGHSPSISVSHPPSGSNGASSAPLFPPTSPGFSRDGGGANGHLHPGVAEYQYSSDSDAEASHGLAMLAMAEEDDARRRQSGGSQMRFSGGYGSQRNSQRTSQPHYQMPQNDSSEGDDYGMVDMSSFGGGYDVHMAYGGDPSALAVGGDINGYDAHSQPVSSQHSSMRRSHASQSSQASRADYDYYSEVIHPFRPFNAPARVDAGGTGGLSEPTADGRRQSYDEGDEYAFIDGGIPDRFPDEPPDIFYRPASISHRPLPPPPEGEQLPQLQTDFRAPPAVPPYPVGPDGYNYNQQGQWVPRSSSLMDRSTTPQVYQPLRSKTDAEERRLKAQQVNRKSDLSTIEGTPATMTPAIDLPSIPGKRFMPSQLGAPAFKKCDEPWSLMSILKWLLVVINPEQITELREADVKEALVALFTNKVPTMNIADAETLSNRVVQGMYEAETLMATEEWVKIMPGTMSGVILQLTGSGCYSPTLHDHMVPGRCYAHHCQRTLKKVNLQAQPARTSESWAEFYKLKREDWETKDKKELERQYMLHEIVQTEEQYMEQLNVLRALYRDPLGSVEPSIITPKRKDKFLQDVFGKIDVVKQANEDHLLPQLKYRQQEQGPWIVGFSDIFRQWIRKAKSAYIDYAGGFPGATFLVRQEVDRNLEFRNFIDRARNDKRSTKLGWDTFLKAPITRLQRYTLLLNTVLKTMKTESEEKTNLKIAYDEVKAVTLECDTRVAEMQRKVDLTDLTHKLVLRPGMQSAVELNLDHFGRELIHRGDLQRMGENKFTWLNSHGLLFDHYLVLAKTVAQRSEQGGKFEKYDVSRLPIPMDLLILESSNDPAVQKSSYMKGVTTVRDVGGRTATPQAEPGAVVRTQSNASPVPGLPHSNTGNSQTSNLATVTSLTEGKDADKIMYPFKVKHLGRDTYTLFVQTEQARREWCAKILEAKTKHAASLHNQNAEPFKLRIMADAAFAFEGVPPGGRAPTIKGTPVDRAIKEVEQKFKDPVRPAPLCRAKVNCATSFSTPVPDNKQMVAVGTDYGVYISDMSNPRGWSKAISSPKVTQIAVLEEFNLFLLISEGQLIAYYLNTIYEGDNHAGAGNDSISQTPRKLSGSKEVGFFVVGKMKDRTLLFYKKNHSASSVFKVLEPIYQKSTEKKRGLFKRGNTEFFREFDEFYIPVHCTGMNLFHSSLAVSTARGFEVLNLERKQPHSVPEFTEHAQKIASHIKEETALAMLRLSDQEFLLVYASCAVYVNKHGQVSRSVIMEFVGKAHSAALYGAYLVLFDNDFVEIRNAQNGRLKQIIAGRETKCLDDGGSWSAAGAQGANGTINGPAVSGRTVKFVMQHPELEKTQIVVELLLNENMKE